MTRNAAVSMQGMSGVFTGAYPSHGQLNDHDNDSDHGPIWPGQPTGFGRHEASEKRKETLQGAASDQVPDSAPGSVTWNQAAQVRAQLAEELRREKMMSIPSPSPAAAWKEPWGTPTAERHNSESGATFGGPGSAGTSPALPYATAPLAAPDKRRRSSRDEYGQPTLRTTDSGSLDLSGWPPKPGASASAAAAAASVSAGFHNFEGWDVPGATGNPAAAVPSPKGTVPSSPGVTWPDVAAPVAKGRTPRHRHDSGTKAATEERDSIGGGWPGPAAAVAAAATAASSIPQDPWPPQPQIAEPVARPMRRGGGFGGAAERAPGAFDEAILAALAALPQHSLVKVLQQLSERRPVEVALAFNADVHGHAGSSRRAETAADAEAAPAWDKLGSPETPTAQASDVWTTQQATTSPPPLAPASPDEHASAASLEETAELARAEDAGAEDSSARDAAPLLLARADACGKSESSDEGGCAWLDMIPDIRVSEPPPTKNPPPSSTTPPWLDSVSDTPDVSPPVAVADEPKPASPGPAWLAAVPDPVVGGAPPWQAAKPEPSKPEPAPIQEPHAAAASPPPVQASPFEVNGAAESTTAPPVAPAFPGDTWPFSLEPQKSSVWPMNVASAPPLLPWPEASSTAASGGGISAPWPAVQPAGGQWPPPLQTAGGWP